MVLLAVFRFKVVKPDSFFVPLHTKIRKSSMAQIDEFFFDTNRVEGITEADYERAQPYIEAAQAFAQSTYQGIYIIDYFRKNFLYVSDNPLFLPVSNSALLLTSDGIRVAASVSAPNTISITPAYCFIFFIICEYVLFRLQK